MSLHAASPAALVLVLAVPLFFAGTRGARLAAACRALAATALVLVLAGLSRERDRPAAGACVVATIDVSASVGRAAVESARAHLGALLPALGAGDLLGAVAFAARPRVLAAPTPGPHALDALLPAADAANPDSGDTDIAAAVATAAALCPEGRQAAILLFTDGNETAGSVAAEAALIEPRVPIFPVVPPAAALAPVAIRRLRAPALAPEGAPVLVEAVVESREPTTAAVALTVDDAALPPRPVDLPPGTSVVPLVYRASDRGPHALAARLLLPPDRPPAPGVARAALTVTGPVRVLVVTEREEPPVAAVALAARGMEVEVLSSPAFTARAARLDAIHAVVLDDVGRAGLPDPALEALAARVAGGGALIVTGGAHLFGDPGLVGTALERLLPVTLESQEPEPRARDPIALYLLIDRSNSMAEVGPQGIAKMEYARRAALAVLEQLDAQDLVGAIAFDSEAYEMGPLGPAGERRAALAARIRRLRHGGGTDFKDALALAGRSLAAAGPRVRHVILLTDGDTNRRADDHTEVVEELARAGVSVTAIRIGADAVNLDLLAAISRTTGGEFHHVETMETLPQLMIRDAQRQMDASAGRRDARAHIGEPGPMLAGIDEEELPPVPRWAITRPKPEAELRLWVEADGRRDPLLATWQYELGRVAVLPLDFQAGAAGWTGWRDFARLWTQLVRWAAPPGLAVDRQVAVERRPEGVTIRVDTLANELVPPVLRLPPPAGEVVLHETGRRRFTALVPDLAPGVHEAVLRTTAGDEAIALAVPADAASGREGRAAGPALPLLARLAAASGGRVDPEPAAVLATRAGFTRERQPLAAWLVPIALAAVLADVALRRGTAA